MLIEELMAAKDNTLIKGTYAINEIKLKSFKEKDDFFLVLFLHDKTGRISAKVWDNAEKFYERFKDNTVVDIEGQINFYGGKNQVIISKAEENNNFDVKDFVKTAKKNCDDMFDELVSLMNQNITNDDIKKIFENGYLNDKNFINNFKFCPGGKGDVHHAYISGLLEHTLSVVKISIFYADHFRSENINKSILIFGAFLHDLGKIEAYNFDLSIEMTDIGRLHGHIPLGYHSFCQIISKVNDESNLKNYEELKLILGHIILCHHGNQQSMIVPMTKEAALISFADNNDAEVFHISQVTEKTKSEWSIYDHLRERMYFKGSFEEEKKIIIKRKKTS